jgi:chlorite dismutase
MPEQTPQTFNHFALVAFTADYWREPPDARRAIVCGWLERLRAATDAVHLYQTFGVEAGTDMLVWSAVAGDDVAIPQRFFATFAQALASARRYVTVPTALWGLTKPSQYTKTRSTQELDPFAPARASYLVMYPFTKTSSWYQLPGEERRRMMMDHIKVGKQYEDITQLLLYSTGLQDQEFVVVYETDDLLRFSSLVTELRSTEGRPYTERDTPLHTAIHLPDSDALMRWL